MDIHPAARIGRGILVDHATGVVIGETAVIGDNVSMLHHVTLGGSGTGQGVRHPTIGEFWLVILSNVTTLSVMVLCPALSISSEGGQALAICKKHG